VDQKSRAAAHVVGARGVQVVAIVHALESAHVAKGVGALRKGAHRDLALARGVVAAAAGLTAAGTVSIDLTAVERGTVKMMGTLRVSVWSTSGDVVLLEEFFLGAWRSAHTYRTTSRQQCNKNPGPLLTLIFRVEEVVIAESHGEQGHDQHVDDALHISEI
jgi:hypothetical protein